MDAGRMEQHQVMKEELLALHRRLRVEQQAISDLTAKYDALCCDAVDNEEAAQEAAALHRQAETIKPKIRGLEILIGQKEAAKAVLEKAISAEFQAERQKADRVAKYERWQGLAVECGTAREEMESLTRQLTAAQDAVDEQADVIRHWRDGLSNHIEAKPKTSDFPTQAELAKWSTRHKALEAAVAESFAEMRRRSDNRSDIVAAQLQARIRFERLVFQEGHARLPGFELAAAS